MPNAQVIIYFRYHRLGLKLCDLDPSTLAYLAKALESIAGHSTVYDIVNMSDDKLQELLDAATRVAKQIWNIHPGMWEVSVIPSNKSTLKFLEKSISEFTYGTFNNQIKEVVYDDHCPRRIIF